MSKMQIHHDDIVRLADMGITTDAMLMLTDEQVGRVLDQLHSDASQDELVKVVTLYVARSMEGSTMTHEDRKAKLTELMGDTPIKDLTSEERKDILTGMLNEPIKEDTMTKSRTLGTTVGMVVGTGAEKVARGALATKTWWNTDGKAATIAVGKTTKKGILGTMRAIKDVVAGAAEGAKASYHINKANRK